MSKDVERFSECSQAICMPSFEGSLFSLSDHLLTVAWGFLMSNAFGFLYISESVSLSVEHLPKMFPTLQLVFSLCGEVFIPFGVFDFTKSHFFFFQFLGLFLVLAGYYSESSSLNLCAEVFFPL